MTKPLLFEREARAVVVNPRWRWMPGIHVRAVVELDGPLLPSPGDDVGIVFRVGIHGTGLVDVLWPDMRDDWSARWGDTARIRSHAGGGHHLLPVLDHPATRGCLHQMVCDALGEPGLYVVGAGGPTWCVERAPGEWLRYDGTWGEEWGPSAADPISEPSPVEALVAALAAAARVPVVGEVK